VTNSGKRSALVGIGMAALMAFGPLAFADEVTTQTKTTTTKTPPDIVVVAPPAGGAVLGDDAGCSTKKMTKTDGETGDTVKKTTTDCN